MTKNINEKEEMKTERFTKAQVGLMALGVVGAGMGIFGFARGYKFGYKRGFTNGEVFANDQFRDLANELIALRESKEGE
jgi:hypothetical protein